MDIYTTDILLCPKYLRERGPFVIPHKSLDIPLFLIGLLVYTMTSVKLGLPLHLDVFLLLL